DAQLLDLPPLLGGPLTANLDQAEVTLSRWSARKDLQEDIDPLARDRTAPMQKERLAVDPIHRIRGRSRLPRRRLELGRDAVRGLYQSGRVEQIVRLDLPADGRRAVKDHGGLLKAPEDPSCHRLEPAWPGFPLRLQQTPKRVQVMAEDAGTVLRQSVYELAITVVADMKEMTITDAWADV